ncbi:hypothetical protein PC122_g20970 [Phytophthora cactorum]|nr:hypothetical protein PC122_g20970 [Phytophthora cactorum]
MAQRSPVADADPSERRRADDITWILAYLKKVLRERYAVTFEPRYVMTDTDDAQHNACVRELPSTTILMCWFHVF